MTAWGLAAVRFDLIPGAAAAISWCAVVAAAARILGDCSGHGQVRQPPGRTIPSAAVDSEGSFSRHARPGAHRPDVDGGGGRHGVEAVGVECGGPRRVGVRYLLPRADAPPSQGRYEVVRCAQRKCKIATPLRRQAPQSVWQPDRGNSGVSGASDEPVLQAPRALRPEPAGHNCPAPRPNPARPSRQTASCPQTARPARTAGITSRRESWAACRSASASVTTRHCAPTRPPEAAVRGLQNIGYVLCALLRPAIAPHTDRASCGPADRPRNPAGHAVRGEADGDMAGAAEGDQRVIARW